MKAVITLSVITALALAAFLPGGWIFNALNGYRALFERKATGLGAVAGGLTASLLSPLFWIFAAVLFALFLAASRLCNQVLRVLLFWIPTLVVSTLGVAVSSLLAYMFLHLRARG